MRKKNNYTFDYAVDKNHILADAFGATRTPEIFLFDKNDKLVYHGAIDDNQNSIEEVTRRHLSIAIDEMLKKEPVSTSTTRSVGCTIKRLKN